MIERVRLFHRLPLIVLVGMAWLSDSCKKNSGNPEPGISYGITGVEPAIGANGDTISIYGAGFLTDKAGNVVTIHGAAAQVIDASERLLKVVVPAGPRQGDVGVKTGSKSANYSSPFTLMNVVMGNYGHDTMWTADRLYLLRGDIHFTKGATLTVQAGTTVMADKFNMASLTIDDGASIQLNGTAANPIVFTSNQVIGLRYPGDWVGITLSASASPAADKISYTRIEYAGSHPSNQPGAALLINRPIPVANIQYVEAAYSNGDGFRADAVAATQQYLKYLLAFGCAGNDFAFEGSSRVLGQFMVGIKDPVYADALGSDGLLVQSSQPVTISNLSLVGYEDLERNITGQNPQRTYGMSIIALNPNSGRGVHVGGYNYNGVVTLGTLQLFNSLVAAPFRAGISIDGPAVWAAYEDGTPGGTVIRHTTVTCVPNSNPDNAIYGGNNPYRDGIQLQGYVFSAEGLAGPLTGYSYVDATPQLAAFGMHNDSLGLLSVQAQNSTVPYVDEAGIRNMVLYKNLAGPLMIPNNGSPLFSGADFTDARLSDPFFDGSGTYRGSFGATDWTKGWVNFNPQQTSYQ